MTLHEETCIPCHANATPLDASTIENLLPALPDWTLIQQDGVNQLERIHRCTDFATALHLANCIGALAESENHHPELVVAWGQLRIRFWTHAIGGLHRNDFILAARTEQILQAY